MRTRMKILTFFLAFSLTACSANPAPQVTPTTLPPTLTPVQSATSTETPSPTATPNPPAIPTAQSNCTNSALFIADVSIPDGANLPAGQPFTKTWRLRNSGTCTWNSGYTLNFLAGDRMEGPPVIPLREVTPGAEIDLSIELNAPGSNGTFTGFYEIRDPAGKIVPVGFLSNIWVKITVGSVASAPILAATPQAGSAATIVPPTQGVCNPSLNSAAAGQIINLINTVRAENGLPALAPNERLDAAALRHSTDMACNNLRGHTGSDGSSVGQRVAEAGYAASRSEEIIYVGGGAEAAYTWWMNDQIHRDAILRASHTNIGVSVSYQSGSAFGTYISVVLASP